MSVLALAYAAALSVPQAAMPSDEEALTCRDLANVVYGANYYRQAASDILDVLLMVHVANVPEREAEEARKIVYDAFAQPYIADGYAADVFVMAYTLEFELKCLEEKSK